MDLLWRRADVGNQNTKLILTMTHRVTLEIETSIEALSSFTAEFDQVKDAEFPSEIEISSSDAYITLVIGDAISVDLTPRESVILASLILERTYKQI
jgi:hypothetical protein